jgi:hypothetical protein
MLSVPAAVAYQGLISVFGALTAISLASIGERLMRARTAAFVAFFAAGANLTYQYALQGSLKELGLLAALAAVAAIAESAVRLERPYAAAALVAVAVAAALDIYSAVAVAFLGALLLSLGIGLLVTRRTRPSRRWVRAAAVGAVLAAVLAVPVLTTFSTFFHVAQTGQGSSGLGSIQFGQLLRALPLSQISGVWLAGEYRLPVVPQPAATLTVIATVAILVLAVPGALIALRRRSLGPLMLLGGVGLVLAIVYPRVSPYAQGKLLAIGGPLVLFAALLALAMPRGRIAMLGTLLGCGLAVAVLASDLLAYGRDRIAPTSRMEAIQQVGDRFRGQGLVLWNEFEEYAKYFARAALISSPFEAITPQQVQLRHPVYFYGHYFDLDEELLSFVESDPLIVTRRSPAASRPPANFSLVYSNRYYLVWRRLARPRVLGHLPEQTLYSPAAPVDCRALARMARGAPPGSELVAATPPEMTFFEPLYSRDRSLPWGIDPAQPGAVIPNGPGHASGTLVVHARGEYAVWAQGDFPRPVQIRLDGRTLGSAAGSDTPLQWTHVADVVLGPGRHDLSVNRAAGHRHFGPGEWNIGTIGPIALQRRSAETLTTLPPGRWRSLCRTRRDWVELVRP